MLTFFAIGGIIYTLCRTRPSRRPSLRGRGRYGSLVSCAMRREGGYEYNVYIGSTIRRKVGTMSHPVTIPSDYARVLQRDLEAGRVTDAQKVQHFGRLVDWAAWLEGETQVDTIEALQAQIRRIEREKRELKDANEKLKEERKTRRERRTSKETIRRGGHCHTDRYELLSREAQEERCWEQFSQGDVA